MKKALLIMIAFVLLLAGAGYLVTVTEEKEPQPVNLPGNWKQAAAGSSYQAAVITENEINIYWISDGGKSQSLYWSGSVDIPKAGTLEPYTWVSKNNHEKTDYAMLASPDDTKEFTCNDGKISYSASAAGTTTTVYLVRTEDVIPNPAAN